MASAGEEKRKNRRVETVSEICFTNINLPIYEDLSTYSQRSKLTK